MESSGFSCEASGESAKTREYEGTPARHNGRDMSDPEIITLSAHSPFEAQVVATILQDAGIPAYVSGRMLTDPVAISQELMNVAEVEIQVPADRLDEARKVVEEARKAGKLLDRPDFDPGSQTEGE